MSNLESFWAETMSDWEPTWIMKNSFEALFVKSSGFVSFRFNFTHFVPKTNKTVLMTRLMPGPALMRDASRQCKQTPTVTLW